jgi:proline dehydrogenase
MLPPVASNFVAGETADAALDHAREVNAGGVGAILNLLGEHYEERGPADADADAYVSLVDDVAAAGVRACVSVKPSQIGLGVGRDVFEANLARIVDAAVAADTFVWLDMEDHTTTDATLDAYERFARETGGRVGVCVQANLRRTADDLERLAPLPGKVRLVKGAYDEPASIAYRTRDAVDRAYRDLLDDAFAEFAGGVAVGSHDPEMIDHARRLHETHGTEFEIQMLMGVRESAQFDLADRYDVWQYVPFGSKWLSYFYRRVRERKENAVFALRAVLSG